MARGVGARHAVFPGVVLRPQVPQWVLLCRCDHDVGTAGAVGVFLDSSFLVLSSLRVKKAQVGRLQGRSEWRR